MRTGLARPFGSEMWEGGRWRPKRHWLSLEWLGQAGRPSVFTLSFGAKGSPLLTVLPKPPDRLSELRLTVVRSD